MKGSYILSPERILSDEEKSMVYKKPDFHVDSKEEIRICEEVKRNWNKKDMKITNILLEGDAGSGKTQLAKALSHDFGLPYTKITCFSDMDKSDVMGSILPVADEEKDDDNMIDSDGIRYKYYPSEIIRAYENGWILEIQEPTVIRDAAVLMALNSALEIDGCINLPTRTVRRHPDFIAVITTNRGYNGTRPLNESLRDRFQHSEKMNLPDIEVMVKRAKSKVGCDDEKILRSFAEVIILLDNTAKANSIRGVAGMRSYFFWLDSALAGMSPMDSLYNKVIYKITTDEDEIEILERALKEGNHLDNLDEIGKYIEEKSKYLTEEDEKKEDDKYIEEESKNLSDRLDNKADKNLGKSSSNKDSGDGDNFFKPEVPKKTIEKNSNKISKSAQTEDGNGAIYHELLDKDESLEVEEKNLRKKLNKDAREAVVGTNHEGINLIVHRPKQENGNREEYEAILSEINPVIKELVRKVNPLLEFEESQDSFKNRLYGDKFLSEKVINKDFRYFSKKKQPDIKPSLAVVLRVDLSASMKAFGRLEFAKKSVVSVFEFCKALDIPILVYGDTADRSKIEQMSLFSYIDWEEPNLINKYTLMNIKPYSNNRDGMAIRILSERLLKMPQTTKLFISISDGQPRAMPDYVGEKALADMKSTISEYSRKGITFLSAAIGIDKDTIANIYGRDRFLDISDLRKMPTDLIKIISKYIS